MRADVVWIAPYYRSSQRAPVEATLFYSSSPVALLVLLCSSKDSQPQSFILVYLAYTSFRSEYCPALRLPNWDILCF